MTDVLTRRVRAAPGRSAEEGSARISMTAGPLPDFEWTEEFDRPSDTAAGRIDFRRLRVAIGAEFYDGPTSYRQHAGRWRGPIRAEGTALPVSHPLWTIELVRGATVLDAGTHGDVHGRRTTHYRVGIDVMQATGDSPLAFEPPGPRPEQQLRAMPGSVDLDDRGRLVRTEYALDGLSLVCELWDFGTPVDDLEPPQEPIPLSDSF